MNIKEIDMKTFEQWERSENALWGTTTCSTCPSSYQKGYLIGYQQGKADALPELTEDEWNNLHNNFQYGGNGLVNKIIKHLLEQRRI